MLVEGGRRASISVSNPKLLSSAQPEKSSMLFEQIADFEVFFPIKITGHDKRTSQLTIYHGSQATRPSSFLEKVRQNNSALYIQPKFTAYLD